MTLPQLVCRDLGSSASEMDPAVENSETPAPEGVPSETNDQPKETVTSEPVEAPNAPEQTPEVSETSNVEPAESVEAAEPVEPTETAPIDTQAVETAQTGDNEAQAAEQPPAEQKSDQPDQQANPLGMSCN